MSTHTALNDYDPDEAWTDFNSVMGTETPMSCGGSSSCGRCGEGGVRKTSHLGHRIDLTGGNPVRSRASPFSMQPWRGRCGQHTTKTVNFILPALQRVPQWRGRRGGRRYDRPTGFWVDIDLSDPRLRSRKPYLLSRLVCKAKGWLPPCWHPPECAERGVHR
jgi:hypothetical protein